jgi:putative DNA primase/helicase
LVRLEKAPLPSQAKSLTQAAHNPSPAANGATRPLATSALEALKAITREEVAEIRAGGRKKKTRLAIAVDARLLGISLADYERWAESTGAYNTTAPKSEWGFKAHGGATLSGQLEKLARKCGWVGTLQVSDLRRYDEEAARLQLTERKQSSASKAARVLATCLPYQSADGHHAYIARKHGEAFTAGLYLATAESTGLGSKSPVDALVVPGYDAAGELQSLQWIPRSGVGKYTLADTVAKGMRFWIGERSARTIVVVEGIGTAFAIKHALDDASITAVVAFGKDQILDVATSIAADNRTVFAAFDAGNEVKKEAVDKAGIGWLPMPTAYQATNNADWHDVLEAEGKDATAAHLRRALTPQNIARLPRSASDDLRSAASQIAKPARTIEELRSRIDAGAPPDAETLAAARYVAGCVPVLHDASTALRMVKELCDSAKITDETRNSITEDARWRIDTRRKACLSSLVLTSDDVSDLHHFEIVPTLDGLDLAAMATPGAVTLISAPTGSGKTQRVAAPLLQAAADRKAFAIVHRETLARELERRFDRAAFYRDHAEIDGDVQTLVACVNSFAAQRHAEHYDAADLAILDEWDQTSKALANKRAKCADRRSPADVFDALAAKLSNPTTTIVAMDATLSPASLRFLEACRPKQKFHIITMQPPTDRGTARIAFGLDQYLPTFAQLFGELANGGRAIVPCESKDRAHEIARMLAAALPEKRVLVLTGDNRDAPDQAAFIASPEAESRRYDCIIHTATIDAGVSIEHGERESEALSKVVEKHFTAGFAFFSGRAITPASALQMIGRVRYLKGWTICLINNNAGDRELDAESTQAVFDALSDGQGLTAYDRFQTAIEAEQAAARRDFAATLVYALAHNGWTIDRVKYERTESGAAKEIKATLAAEKLAKTLAAADLSPADAQRLNDDRNDPVSAYVFPFIRGAELQDAITYALRKAAIRRALGIGWRTPITAADVEAWDEGRGPAKWDRFTAAVLGLARPDRDGERNQVMRRHDAARMALYRHLADGRNWTTHEWTEDEALALRQRLEPVRELAAVLGVVGGRWAGHRSPGKAYPIRLATEILDRMGIDASRIRNRHPASVVPDPQCSPNEPLGKTGGSGTTEAKRYGPDPESVAAVRELAARRNAQKEDLAPVDSLSPDLPAVCAGRLLTPPLPLAVRVGEAWARVPRAGATWRAWEAWRGRPPTPLGTPA